jgi:small-conductance mechanosensitive channel
VKTRLNEEVTIPNAVVVSGNTVNYSRLEKDGVYAATAVTIGYDTPWRQVEAMLLAAADETPGLRHDRPPRVLQTALSDFYVEYTMLVCPEKPPQRVPVLAALHARIQDVFNEHGVQIMSPHYESDPAESKLVPPERWHESPAKPPDAEVRAGRNR